jgi:hypothetical protein
MPNFDGGHVLLARVERGSKSLVGRELRLAAREPRPAFLKILQGKRVGRRGCLLARA